MVYTTNGQKHDQDLYVAQLLQLPESQKMV